MRTLVCLNNNLRLADNPALRYAMERGEVIPVYIHDPQQAAPWQYGGAKKWWLHHSLESITKQLQLIGSRLIIRTGNAQTELARLLVESGASALAYYRSNIPAEVKQQELSVADLNCDVQCFAPPLLFKPGSVFNLQGKPYKVFTPFWRTCIGSGLPENTLAPPDYLPQVDKSLASIDLANLSLCPRTPWDSQFYDTWTPGEPSALEKLAHFCEEKLIDYSKQRDIFSVGIGSLLSAHLSMGEITPQRIISEVNKYITVYSDSGLISAAEKFFSELGWREFANQLLHHFPTMTEEPLNGNYRGFPWRNHSPLLRAWQDGSTGIPVVDAGMRQLWLTGTMHNRVRMIVASFLTKNAGVHWLQGARWFWDTLVDADLAINSFNWQWVAGCGADAAPYYRIFNPVLQGEKFDSQGVYVKRWLPELRHLPNKYIHSPWLASSDVLSQSGVSLDGNYPRPIVDLAESRKRALEDYRCSV